jgi:hypothetical protein
MAGMGGKQTFQCYHGAIMRRVETVTLCIALAPLSGCWHEPFHTSVENGTNQTIYATIQFDDHAIPPGRGNIEPGNGVSLTQTIEDISYIEYQIGDRRCRLDEKLIAKIARADGRGVKSVTLTNCAQPNA